MSGGPEGSLRPYYTILGFSFFNATTWMIALGTPLVYRSSRTPLYDEHWLQSGTHGWAAVSMVQLALDAVGQNPGNWSLEIVSYEDENIEVDLDMSLLAY